MLVNRETVRQFGGGRDDHVGQTLDVLPDAGSAVHAGSQDASGGGLEPPVEIRVRPLRTAEGAFVLASAATPSDQTETNWPQALQEQLEFERFVAELSG
ncbi:MAG: hypothetical protein ACHQRO_11765, partial [Vicinamibacteria bacterium]